MCTENIKAVKIALPIKQTHPLISFLGPLLLGRPQGDILKNTACEIQRLETIYALENIYQLWDFDVLGEWISMAQRCWKWNYGMNKSYFYFFLYTINPSLHAAETLES